MERRWLSWSPSPRERTGMDLCGLQTATNPWRLQRVNCSLGFLPFRYSGKSSCKVALTSPRPIPAALCAAFKSGSLGLCNPAGRGSGLVVLVKESRRNAHYKSDTTTVSASLLSTGASSAQTASALFTLGTVFVIPIYTLMVLAPHSNWTRKLVESDIPYVVLGIIYVYLLALSPTSDTFRLMFSSKHYLPELHGIMKMFSNTFTVASAWIHLLAVDLFAGRQIFLDGLHHAVETRHSLILCFFVCPIGIFSHMVTKSLMLFQRKAITGKEDVTCLRTLS